MLSGWAVAIGGVARAQPSLVLSGRALRCSPPASTIGGDNLARPSTTPADGPVRERAVEGARGSRAAVELLGCRGAAARVPLTARALGALAGASRSRRSGGDGSARPSTTPADGPVRERAVEGAHGGG
ncbi:hypothetical protein OAO87_04220, partial [bacterium]|nr:hypothetical protein [bacterium]